MQAAILNYCPKNGVHYRKQENNYIRNHIVLSHSDLKIPIIQKSVILNSYWKFFKNLLDKTNKLIIFGYSGNDVHLNQMIANRENNMEIRVIEHKMENESKKKRINYWSEILNTKTEKFKSNNLIWMKSILEYSFEHQDVDSKNYRG